ncbi:MAG TPA: alpha-amylase family glycosyl hydrolase [Bryobacteraceae bacterium]|nr:alpha-amylase family glycosyl hydrolase [Bryobacteraceae bacterium]
MINTLLLVTASCAVLAANPVIEKVEPPDWWVGHTINPVRLLIHGKNLQGSMLTAPAGMTIANARISTAGTYLFADLTIPNSTPPGQYQLLLKNGDGSANVPFRVNPPLNNASRQGFTSADLIYLLMPDRFANGDPSNDDPAVSKGLYDRSNPRAYHGGDLKGILDHLPYLKDLGVTAIWMTPIYDNSNLWGEYAGNKVTDYHGYGIVDYYAVDEHLGNLDTLRNLVQWAHTLGIKVIQDQVENHVGPHHPWLTDPPTPTWFHGSITKHLDENWQFWSIADPAASKNLRRIVTDGWFGGSLPDMNQEDPEVSRYQIQNTLWWLGEIGFDSIRQDTWPYVARNFWHDWMAAIKRQFPTVNVVGEVLDGDPATVSFFQGGQTRDGIDTLVDTLFDYPVYFKMRDAFGSGKSLEEVPKMIGHDYLYPNAQLLWTFIGDHDEPRLMNAPQATVDGLKLAYTCMFTIRGVPLLYYGDELGMKGGEDPDNRHDFPGGWPDDAADAFTRAGRTVEQNAVFDHVKKLAHLRASMPVLSRGSTLNLVLQDQQWAYARHLGEEIAVIVLNNDSKAVSLELPLQELGLSPAVRLHGLLDVIREADAVNYRLDISLPARAGEIFVVRP